jgi:hypothetical protein
MTIRLDHTIVPAKDKIASAKFFAEIFGLTVEPDPGHFAGVQVNESLTFAFADEPEEWGGPGFDPRTITRDDRSLAPRARLGKGRSGLWFGFRG